MQNKVVIGRELDRSKSKLYDHISSFKKEVDNKEKSLVTDAKIFSLGWNDSFRLFLSKEHEDISTFNKLLISSINSINKTCPLALPLYFDVLTAGLDSTRSVQEYTRISSEPLLNAFKEYNDVFIQENIGVLSEALYEAGSTGCISINRIDQSNVEPYVSVIDGFRSLCSVDNFFVNELPTTYSTDCYIVPVAGSIIEVSEIHHILEHAYETKSTVILIASSFSDDVANTLLVNWQQGKTNVFPFTLEDSLASVNEIRDVCSVLGVLPISTDTGLRLSSLNIEDYNNKSFLYDQKTKTLRLMPDEAGVIRINDMRDRLQNKLEKERVPDVIDILSERVSRMSSRNVGLHLHFGSSEKGLIEDRASAFFTYFSKCAQQGVTLMPSEYPIRYLPRLEFAKAVRRAKKDREFINSVKAVLEIET